MQSRRLSLRNASKLFDVAVVCVVLWTSSYSGRVLRHTFPLSSFSIRIKLSKLCDFRGDSVCLPPRFFHVWAHESRRLSPSAQKASTLFKAATVSTICLILMAAIFSIAMMTPLFLIAFWAISSSLICSSRLLLRYWLAGVRRRDAICVHMLF